MARVLVVEDNSRLRRTLRRALEQRGYRAQAAASVAEAVEILGSFKPDVLLLDVSLPDGDALAVVQAARRLGATAVAIAMSGKATPLQTFQLAQLGARRYLQKPIELDILDAALEEALSTAPDLEPHLRATVGKKPIHEVESEIRATMVDEALARAGGNRQRAASLLSISRQLLQHILKKLR
jgi:DNA-binding NtrC family response regulator